MSKIVFVTIGYIEWRKGQDILIDAIEKLPSNILDETEFLNVHLHTRSQIDEMIQTGEFPQATHVLALLLSDKA